MIFLLFPFFFRQKKSEDNDSISWGFFTYQIKPRSKSFLFLNSIVMNCNVPDNGGCIFIQNKETEISISGSSFIHSASAKTGGALFLDIKKSDFSNCCIQNCTSKESASSICVRGVDQMVDNLISNAAITLCDCNKSTIEISQGNQNIYLVNVSNNHAKSIGSGIYIQPNQDKSMVSLFNVVNNIGEITLDFQYSLEVTSVMKSNFINNTNTHSKGYILISSGQWDFRYCVFLRNKGTAFHHLSDDISFINCSFDIPLPTESMFITRDIHYVTDCPLNKIEDLYLGFCPAFGTPTSPMPSPTPGITIKEPLPHSFSANPQSQTISYTNTYPATQTIQIQNKNGFFTLLLLPITIIGLAALTFMICSSIIKPSFDPNDENNPIMNGVDEQDIIDIVVEEEEMPSNNDDNNNSE